MGALGFHLILYKQARFGNPDRNEVTTCPESTGRLFAKWDFGFIAEISKTAVQCFGKYDP
jgi:hypothetical protein